MKIVHVDVYKNALNRSNQIARLLLVGKGIPHHDLTKLSIAELEEKYPEVVSDTIKNFIAQCHLSALRTEYQKLHLLLGDPLT